MARALAGHLLAFGLLIFSASALVAAQPGEELLPESTKAFLSIPSVTDLRENFDKTQLGHLIKDPLMKPFMDDLRRQLQDKWSRNHTKLNITWDDLVEVPSGEVSIGVVGLGKGASAMLLVADVTGRKQQTTALLAKIRENMQARNATQSTSRAADAEMTIYAIPKTEDHAARQAVFFVSHDLLVAADNQGVAEELAVRIGRKNKGTLGTVEAFQSVMTRCKAKAGGLVPHARWYVEPFGYAKIARANRSEPRKKGTDMLKILEHEGFAAVQGLGGYVNFAADRYEILHRTAVYAPRSRALSELVAKYAGADVAKVVEATGLSRFAVKELRANKDNDSKYELAARMLDFPNEGNLVAQPWISRELATYASFHWNTKKAFDSVRTVVNDVVNDEVFEDVLDSIKTDENGPKIDIRKDLIALLGQRVTVVSEYQLPIGPKSERMLFAVNTNNPAALAVTVEKWMKSDPQARRREVAGSVIWELVEEASDVPMVMIENSPGLAPGGASEDEEGGKPLLPNQAVTVAHGHLLVASHIDFLSRILAEANNPEKLTASTDYQLVRAELAKLNPDKGCAEFFSRTDEEYRPVYELVRTGKMPQAESMLGRMLNALLGDGKEGVVRPQRIDGSKLPEYDAVRRYLGPAGITVATEEEGWFITGFSVSKEARPSDASATTAQEPGRPRS